MTAPAEFDAFEGSYRSDLEASLGGMDADRFTRVKAEHLLDLCRRRIGEPGALRVLDIGCGPGTTDVHLAGSVGELHGVDISAGMIRAARKANPGVRYAEYAGDRLPYDDGTFDLAFAICVLHHVPPPNREQFTREMARVLRPGGLAVIMEHNPFNPLTQWIVSECPFDRDAVLLPLRESESLLRTASLRPMESRFILFFPWEGARWRNAENVISRVPLGAQYLAAARKTRET